MGKKDEESGGLRCVQRHSLERPSSGFGMTIWERSTKPRSASGSLSASRRCTHLLRKGRSFQLRQHHPAAQQERVEELPPSRAW